MCLGWAAAETAVVWLAGWPGLLPDMLLHCVSNTLTIMIFMLVINWLALGA